MNEESKTKKAKKELKQVLGAVNTSKLEVEKLSEEGVTLKDGLTSGKKELKKQEKDIESGEALLINIQKKIDVKLAKKAEADKELGEVNSVIEERNSQLKIEEKKIVDAKKETEVERGKITTIVSNLKEDALKAVKELLK